MNGRPGRVCVLAAIVVAVGSGCGSTQRDPAEDVAQAFYASVADRDGAAACELLAPETRTELEQSSSKACSEALLSEQLPASMAVLAIYPRQRNSSQSKPVGTPHDATGVDG